MPAMVIDERIHETANITGTGEYTLAGAATGKQPLSVIGANNYAPLFVTDDINWELGLYTYVSGPGRAQRTHVVRSSNGGAAVNWNNANVKIKCGWPAWLTDHRQVSKSVAGSSNVTLTALEQRCRQLVLTGALTGDIEVIVDETRWYWTVFNNTTGDYTLTVKTASGNGVKVDRGARAELLCDGTDVVSADLVEKAFGGASIINGKFDLSVNAGALTVSLVGLDGATPSAANPVWVKVPQLTSNVPNGTYAIRKVTSALSLTVPSGATLAHTSAVASAVYVYVIDNAGTLELAVSKKYAGHVAVVSTVALSTGSDGADIYSTTLRSNVPCCVIGRWKSTQTTAGTWAATTGERQLYPFPRKNPKKTVRAAAASVTHTFDWDALWATVKAQGAGGGGGGAAATAGSQVAIAGPGPAGAYAEKNIDLGSVGQQASLVIGAAGTAGVAGANNGGTGGTSSYTDGVNTVTATGGVGGLGAPATTHQIPSLGGTASGGDINIPGAVGVIGGYNPAATIAFSSRGGDSRYGAGGRHNIGSTVTGIGGLGNGSGGAGGANAASQSAIAGGAGTDGLIEIEEFYQ